MKLKPPRLRHRLILKIMMIFWLTTLCTILANIYITKEIVLTEYKTKNLIEKVQDLTTDAVDIYESEGKKMLKQWYRKIYKKEGLRVVLLDENEQTIITPVRFRANSNRDNYNEDRRSENDVFYKGKSDDRFKLRNPFLNPRWLKFADQNIASRSGRTYTLRVLPSPYLRSKFSAESLHNYRRIVTFLIIFAGSWWLARFVAKPVNILRKASEQLADGDFSVRVKPEIGKRKDELGQLAQTFDHMALKVESLISNQQQLFRDISHEIRTPLTRQKIAIELARDSSDPNHLLTKIEKQNQVIEDLIENLLTLMQLENSQKMHIEKLDITEIIKTIIDAAELNINAKSLVVSNSTQGDFQVLGDVSLLTRALENLLVNAIKFSPENTEIKINSEQKDQNIFITIQDEGPGIPEQDLKNILNAFYRADKSRNKGTGGFGLGLAIANKIIQQHDAKLSLENSIPSGLKVTITLPNKEVKGNLSS